MRLAESSASDKPGMDLELFNGSTVVATCRAQAHWELVAQYLAGVALQYASSVGAVRPHKVSSQLKETGISHAVSATVTLAVAVHPLGAAAGLGTRVIRSRIKADHDRRTPFTSWATHCAPWSPRRTARSVTWDLRTAGARLTRIDEDAPADKRTGQDRIIYCKGVLAGPRLRQVALVAPDCEQVAAELRRAFGWPEPFADPGVARFGLCNAVFAAGDTFVEVVAPVEPGTLRAGTLSGAVAAAATWRYSRFPT